MEGCRLFILNLSGTSPQLVRYLLGTELLSNLSLKETLIQDWNKRIFVLDGNRFDGTHGFCNLFSTSFVS